MEVVRIRKQDSKKIKEPVLILIFVPKKIGTDVSLIMRY